MCVFILFYFLKIPGKWFLSVPGLFVFSWFLKGKEQGNTVCKEMLWEGGGVKGDVLDEISLVSYNLTFSFVLTYFPLYLYSKLL